MLEAIIAFAVLTFAFLFLYKEQQQFDLDKEGRSVFNLGGAVFRLLYLGMAFISIYGLIWSAMIAGEQTVSSEGNATATYSYLNLTESEVVMRCDNGTMDWSQFPIILCDNPSATLSSEYHLRTAPFVASIATSFGNVSSTTSLPEAVTAGIGGYFSGYNGVMILILSLLFIFIFLNAVSQFRKSRQYEWEKED